MTQISTKKICKRINQKSDTNHSLSAATRHRNILLDTGTNFQTTLQNSHSITATPTIHIGLGTGGDFMTNPVVTLEVTP